MEAAALLCADVCCVLDSDLVALGYAVCTLECKGAYGTLVFDHLAADGAGFAGGQVAVVAVGQVDADFLSCLHLEAVHGLTGLGNVQLVVVRVAHFRSLLLLSSDENTFRRKHFLFRGHSLTEDVFDMNVKCRKVWKRLDEYFWNAWHMCSES